MSRKVPDEALTYPGLRKAFSEAVSPLFSYLLNCRWHVKKYGVVVEHPEKNVGNPSVIRDENGYHLWSSFGGDYIAYWGVSPDGKTGWKSEPEPTVTKEDVASALGKCDYGVWQPCVVEHKGRYFMFLRAEGTPYGWVICVAESDKPEGPWRNVKMVLGSKEKMFCEPAHPWVVKWRDKFLMYVMTVHEELVMARTNYEQVNIAVAESKTPIAEFSYTGYIALRGVLGSWRSGRPYDLSVFNLDDQVLIMACAFESVPGTLAQGGFDMRIGLFVSTDGVRWFECRGNPVIIHTLADEKRYVADSSIMWEGGKLKMWYEGYTDGQNTKTFYAELVPRHTDFRELFINESVGAGSEVASDFVCLDGRKTFQAVANKDGDYTLDVYDPIADDWRELLTRTGVSANTLVSICTEHAGLRFRLRFKNTSTEDGAVSAWAMAED